jgi:hypothetical protein
MPPLGLAGQPAELVESLGRAVGVDGSPAQVSARYIAGLPKVNHRMYKKSLAKPHHQTSWHQALAIRHDLQRIPRHRDASSSQPP